MLSEFATHGHLKLAPRVCACVMDHTQASSSAFDRACVGSGGKGAEVQATVGPPSAQGWIPTIRHSMAVGAAPQHSGEHLLYMQAPSRRHPSPASRARSDSAGLKHT